jgi:hypothetical protein
MPISFTINGVTYQLGFDLNITLTSASLPPAPSIVGFTFKKGHNMAALLGTVHLSPAPVGVTSRPTSITVTPADGSAVTSVTLDMFNPALTFPCNDTDSVTATAQDLNAVGASPLSAPVTVIAAATITAPPPAPSITGISFVDAAVAMKKK